jgi:glycerol-3-phosphate acyltransferase PlsX
MKIVVDCSGNDLGAKVAVEGAVLAMQDCADISVVLCGNRAEIETELKNFSFDHSRVSVIDAPDTITNDESPTEAVRTKSNSSLVKAFDTLKQDENVAGLVSCGSTGAVLTASFLKIGRIKGISRPALCPILPAKNGRKVLLIDSGANVDCKPINISHFAIMATCYAKAYLGVKNPRVALLNIGTEDKKGNEFSHECFEELKHTPVNFVGNMEARDFMSGKYDIVVCDGFYGNILLKATEGSAKFVLDSLKKNIKSRFWSKIGALFMRKTFKDMKQQLNANNYGGAAFLGVKKIVVKGHGASDAIAFKNAILQVRTLAEKDLTKNIEEQVSILEGETENV